VEEFTDLRELLSDLRSLLGRVAREPGAFLPLELVGLYTKAWVEVNQRFDVVDHEIQSGEYAWALATHGLSGPSMQLKLAGFRRNLRRFNARPSRALLRRVLGWADIALESLAGVVGAAGIIVEFKKSVEQGTLDRDVE
jgi:hypothetical protein